MNDCFAGRGRRGGAYTSAALFIKPNTHYFYVCRGGADDLSGLQLGEVRLRARTCAGQKDKDATAASGGELLIVS